MENLSRFPIVIKSNLPPCAFSHICSTQSLISSHNDSIVTILIRSLFAMYRIIIKRRIEINWLQLPQLDWLILEGRILLCVSLFDHLRHLRETMTASRKPYYYLDHDHSKSYRRFSVLIVLYNESKACIFSFFISNFQELAATLHRPCFAFAERTITIFNKYETMKKIVNHTRTLSIKHFGFIWRKRAIVISKQNSIIQILSR